MQDYPLPVDQLDGRTETALGVVCHCGHVALCHELVLELHADVNRGSGRIEQPDYLDDMGIHEYYRHRSISPL